MLHVPTLNKLTFNHVWLKKIRVETRELMLIVATRFVCDGRSNSKTVRIQETGVNALIKVAYFSKTNYSRALRAPCKWLTVENSQLLYLMAKHSRGICENRSSGKNLELGAHKEPGYLKSEILSSGYQRSPCVGRCLHWRTVRLLSKHTHTRVTLWIWFLVS
jgi:hypothetical protein